LKSKECRSAIVYEYYLHRGSRPSTGNSIPFFGFEAEAGVHDDEDIWKTGLASCAHCDRRMQAENVVRTRNRATVVENLFNRTMVKGALKLGRHGFLFLKEKDQ